MAEKNMCPPSTSGLIGKDQSAERQAAMEQRISSLIEEARRLKFFLDLRDRQLIMQRDSWVKAAELALAGDLRALRLRVDMAKAGPLQIVASDIGQPQSSDDTFPMTSNSEEGGHVNPSLQEGDRG